MSSIWYGPYGQGTGTVTFAPQPPVRVVLNGINTAGGLHKAAERVVELEEELKETQFNLSAAIDREYGLAEQVVKLEDKLDAATKQLEILEQMETLGSNDDLASTGHAMAAELEEEREKNHRLANINKLLRQQVDERDELIAALERANEARVQAIGEQLRKLL